MFPSKNKENHKFLNLFLRKCFDMYGIYAWLSLIYENCICKSLQWHLIDYDVIFLIWGVGF